ncbi:MAG: hypothetical protein PVSMB7_07960 [Chloroflexota bacterium]
MMGVKFRWRLLLAALVALTALSTGGGMPALPAAPALQIMATVGGQPDDITIDAQGRLVWGNLARGTVERLEGGHIVTIARHLSLPEGIVALPGGDFIVAEQGRDRIVRIGAHRSSTPIFALRPVPGREGIDGLGRDPRTGNLLVPDSPNGTVLTMSVNGRHVRLLARGLGRPVDAAVDHQGNVLVPDENLGTVVSITPGGRVLYRGALAIPDDVSVDQRGRIWITTLGDGALWVMEPGAAPRRVLTGLANPQGLTLDRCGDPIIVEQNKHRIIRLLLSAASNHCSLSS